MADPVYLSITELPGTGAAAPTVVDFNFAGGYINRSHIKAYILDTTTFARTDVTVLAEHFVTDWRLQLPVSVPVGSVLRVYRDTPKDAPLVDFTNGARINEGNLDLVAQQATFVAAEAIDQLEGSGVEEGFAAATAAANSADDAAASAVAAAASAAAALGSQNSAAASASAASTSAGAAAASQSAAAASAASASSAAAAADSDAAAAASSASAATSSQTAAAGSASSAASSASTATSAASTATSQASAAASSATAAAGSASAASSSATAAAGSASSAAASAASVDAANLVHKTGNETIGGSKTFTSPIVGSITGNAATATNADQLDGIDSTGFTRSTGTSELGSNARTTANAPGAFSGGLTLRNAGGGGGTGTFVDAALHNTLVANIGFLDTGDGGCEVGMSYTPPGDPHTDRRVFGGFRLRNDGICAAKGFLPTGGAGAIGYPALLFSRSTNITIGSTYAGSSLRAQGLARAADNVCTTADNAGPAQTGTWLALTTQSAGPYGCLAFFIRIS